MRAPSLLRSTASASRGVWTIIVGATALASAVTTSEKVSQPTFDLSSLGLVGLAGDFSGVSQYEYTGQRQLSSFAEDKESLLSQLPNGLFTSLAVTDGQINAMCVYETTEGIQGIMIGGSFTSVDGMAANGLVLYNPDTEEVTPMGGNFTGKVNALLCDSASNKVYVGGKFSHDESTNAISWSDGKWEGFPFLGFSGTVETIAKTSNNTILFGGQFDGLQKFVAPTTKNVQTVNLVDAVIQVEQTSDENGFNDPGAITCTNDTSTQWLLKDGEVGSWTSHFEFQIKPTKLRLINANKDGRGTRTFHVRAFPNSGIMNLTYVDPNTKEKKYCEATCDLAQSDEVQDFEFVNVIGMKALRIDIDTFYGAGGGLSSVQLFQDEIFSYADPRFNEPKCAPEGTRSESESSGTWKSQKSSDTDSYVYADLDAAARVDAKIVFTPHVQERARYSIKMFTPGCQQDGTCSTRGKVEITGVVTKDGAAIPPITYMQTNDFDKYDIVYEGFVDVAEGDYKPQISLQPAKDQPWEVVRIVAQKVQFQLQGKVATDEDEEEGDEAEEDGDDTTTGGSGLNGIYEYNPEDTKTPSPSSSAINVAALSLQEGASIRSIIVKDGISYVAGNFTEKDNKFANFFTIDQDGKVADVRGGGLNGAVGVMLQQDDLIYFAGNFTRTKDESVTTAYVSAYDTRSSEWVQLGGGVNAPVKDLSLVNLSIGGKVKNGVAISGSFTKIQPASEDAKSSAADGFAIWIPADNKWLSSDDTQLTISGLISGYIKSGDNEIYAGSVSSNTMSSSGMVYLEAQEGVKLKASSFEFGTSTSTNRKRTIPQSQIKSGVNIGHFYENGDEQWTILGGKFVAKDKDGKTIKNLAFIENESQDVTGPENDFTSDSNIIALEVVDDRLWVGGTLAGSNDISGVAIYDLKTRQRAEVQPGGLTAVNGTATVYSITKRPEFDHIYVAGDFDSAGPLECSNLCRYDTALDEWKPATSSSAPGVIHATKWLNKDHLLVGGNMELNGTTTYLAIFDATTLTFTAHPGNVKDIPGPVTNLLSIGADDNLERYLSGQSANGTPFVLLYRPNEDFIFLQNNFTAGSIITDIEVLMLASSAYHSDSTDIKEDRVLLVAGSLSLPDFGNASVVTYDGTTWLPFLLTTTENGSPGVVSNFFSLKEQLFDVAKESMKKGYVILISLAIALALIFLLVLCGVAASYIRRRREGYVPAPTMGGAEKSTAHMQDRLPPQDLFSHNPQARGAPML